MPFQLLADLVLAVHAGVVLFVVGGLVAIVAGHGLGWRWVDGRGFRFGHLATIGLVVVQSWFGQVCVLTTLESWLRAQAGSPAYRRSFIEHWLQRLIYVEAPPWVFALAYTVFGAAVLLAWWRYPPRPRRFGRDGGA